MRVQESNYCIWIMRTKKIMRAQKASHTWNLTCTILRFPFSTLEIFRITKISHHKYEKFYAKTKWMSEFCGGGYHCYVNNIQISVDEVLQTISIESENIE